MQQYADIYSLPRHPTCFGCHAPIIRSTKMFKMCLKSLLCLSLHLSEARMSSSTAYPETPSACVPLSIRQNKLHAHTKQWQYYSSLYSTLHIFGCPTGRQIFWTECFIVFQRSVKIPFPEIGFTLLSVLVLIFVCVWFGLFYVPRSVHHRIIHIENPTRCNSVSKFYFVFTWSSTCCGRHTAHHQEPKTVLAASGFAYCNKKIQLCIVML